MKTETMAYDDSEYLKDPNNRADFLSELWSSGDQDAFLIGLGRVLEVCGYTAVAAESGVCRSQLYRIVSGSSAVKLETLLSIFKGLHLDANLSLTATKAA